MAERDLGSTFLLPHTHLYKPDRVSCYLGKNKPYPTRGESKNTFNCLGNPHLIIFIILFWGSSTVQIYIQLAYPMDPVRALVSMAWKWLLF